MVQNTQFSIIKWRNILQNTFFFFLIYIIKLRKVRLTSARQKIYLYHKIMLSFQYCSIFCTNHIFKKDVAFKKCTAKSALILKVNTFTLKDIHVNFNVLSCITRYSFTFRLIVLVGIFYSEFETVRKLIHQFLLQPFPVKPLNEKKFSTSHQFSV